MGDLNWWIFDGEPSENGWYAVSTCWDAQEGILPGARMRTKDGWSDGGPVLAYKGPFANEKEAEDMAYIHDMEN